MNEFFLEAVNRSISAGWLVLAVVVLRAALKKAPKWVPVFLWGLVAVRLVCPVSLESALSLIPSAQTISPAIALDPSPSIQSGISPIDRILNPAISGSLSPAAGASANPLQIWIPVLAVVWLAGIAGMLLYAAVSWLRLRRRVDTAVVYRDNILQSEHVDAPFVLGIVRPKIYLPFHLEGTELPHVIAHEQTHIRRKDHWWKSLGFLLLTVYWFHPLMWLAYGLLCRDIELACDERVIQGLDSGQRAAYSQALLRCSIRRAGAACPLAFGEIGVRERVKSIMNYRKPTVWLVAVSVAVCAVTAVCFLTNPRQDFVIQIPVPAGSGDWFAFSAEEISPTRGQIVITSGEGLGDAEVILKAVEVRQENAYEPAYLTPGMPVTMEAERGAWFQIGVHVQNPTTEDRVVSLMVKHIEVRIPDRADLSQYRTKYIGDAPKVSAIAGLLPYPNGYSCASIELQTDREPYGLTIKLSGGEGAQSEDFRSCAATAFDLIENMGTISFTDASSGEAFAFFTRESAAGK